MDKYGVPFLIMRKIILLLLFSLVLFAKNDTFELRIYEQVLHALFPGKTIVRVWSDSPQKKRLFAQLKGFQLTSNPKNADFLLVTKSEKLNAKGVVFVTSYHLLKRFKENAIGGFYWKKGRPNLIFLRPNLQKRGFHLPHSFQKYIEDRP